MMGIKSQFGSFKSKKSLKEYIGNPVRFVETSMFGNEFKGAGSYTVVGPDPLQRKWFATVTVTDDATLVKVS